METNSRSRSISHERNNYINSKDSRISNEGSDLSYLAKLRKFPADSRERSKSLSPIANRSKSPDEDRSASWKSHRKPSLEKMNLDFQIFVFENAVNILKSNDEAYLKELKAKFPDSRIFFHESLEIPDVNGSVLVIQGDNLEKKAEISRSFFQLLKDKNIEERKDKAQNALILVPNGLVSMVIGTKGKQIITLAKNTKSQIAVNQPVFKMVHRTISISGFPSQIAEAMRQIYQIMEERYFEVKNAEVDSKPLDLYELVSTVLIKLINI